MSWHRPGLRPFRQASRDDAAREFLRELRLVASVSRARGESGADGVSAWLTEDAGRLAKLAEIAKTCRDARPHVSALEWLHRLGVADA